jgi:hypothetical protein
MYGGITVGSQGESQMQLHRYLVNGHVTSLKKLGMRLGVNDLNRNTCRACHFTSPLATAENFIEMTELGSEITNPPRREPKFEWFIAAKNV